MCCSRTGSSSPTSAVAARHPLEVGAVAVVVRAVEPRAREALRRASASAPRGARACAAVTWGCLPSPPKWPSPISRPTTMPSSRASMHASLPRAAGQIRGETRGQTPCFTGEKNVKPTPAAVFHRADERETSSSDAARRRGAGRARCPREYVSTSSRSLRCSCTTLRSVALIASSATGRPERAARVGGLVGLPVQHLLAPLAVARGVDRRRARPRRAPLAVGDLEREVLDGVDRLAVAADEQPEVVALERAADAASSSSSTTTPASRPSASTTCSSSSRTRSVGCSALIAASRSSSSCAAAVAAADRSALPLGDVAAARRRAAPSCAAVAPATSRAAAA